MLNYILRRLIIAVFLLLGVSLVSFIVIQLPPGDFASTYKNYLMNQAGQTADEAEKMAQIVRERYGAGGMTSAAASSLERVRSIRDKMQNYLDRGLFIEKEGVVGGGGRRVGSGPVSIRTWAWLWPRACVRPCGATRGPRRYGRRARARRGAPLVRGTRRSRHRIPRSRRRLRGNYCFSDRWRRREQPIAWIRN